MKHIFNIYIKNNSKKYIFSYKGLILKGQIARHAQYMASLFYNTVFILSFNIYALLYVFYDNNTSFNFKKKRLARLSYYIFLMNFW